MFDFEFCIDIGDCKPDCCRQQSYGSHERKIMDKHSHILETNNWICDCEGPWGSLILLAPKPHQEECTDINDFIWRLYVSYRPLNSATRSFEFPIPRCADSIDDFGDFSGRIYFISLDTRCGYHQISVLQHDQEMLAFSTPSGKKKTFKVMSFGPKNASAFYTAMIQFLRADWTILFSKTNQTIKLSDSPSTIIFNNRIIIDDIILFSNHVPTIYITFLALRKFSQNFVFPLN